MKNKIIFPLIAVTFVALIVAVLFYLVPVGVDVYNSMNAYNTRVAKSYDYTKITTPLSKETAIDICTKFDIDVNDKRCQAGITVYGPDFFGDIKSYLRQISKEKATFELVDRKLGAYLVRCEQPGKDGHYRCRYDIRGDGIYPIFVYFSDKGIYYRIIANTGGS